MLKGRLGSLWYICWAICIQNCCGLKPVQCECTCIVLYYGHHWGSPDYRGVLISEVVTQYYFWDSSKCPEVFLSQSVLIIVVHALYWGSAYTCTIQYMYIYIYIFQAFNLFYYMYLYLYISCYDKCMYCWCGGGWNVVLWLLWQLFAVTLPVIQ